MAGYTTTYLPKPTSMRQKIKLQTLFIYSKKDEHIQNELDPYLNASEILQYMHQPIYQRVEAIDQGRYLQDIDRKYDLIFFLCSMDLLNNDFFSNSSIKNTLYLHRVNRLRIIPIQYKEVLPGNNPFQNLDCFPRDSRTITDRSWKSNSQAYKTIITDIKPILIKEQDYKTNLEDQWRLANTTNNIDEFEDFLARYPYSKYEPEAKERKIQLLEQEAWEYASDEDSIKAYYNYIINTENKKRRFKAAQRIYTIEQSELQNWNEAVEQDKLNLHYRYKTKFQNSKQFPQSTIYIRKNLKDYDEVETMELDGLSSTYLEYSGYENLRNQPGALFAMHTHNKHFEVLGKKIDKQRKWINYGTSTPGLVAFTIVLLIPILVNSESWILFKSFQFALYIEMLRRCYLAYRFMKKDIEYLTKAIDFTHQMTILAKVYQSNQDQTSVKHILTFSELIEERLNLIKSKRLWYYFFQSKKQAPGVKDLPH